MSAGKYNDSQSSATKIKQYASGGARNLVADSPDGATCARAIELLADSTTTTSVKSAADVEMGPITGWPKGIKMGEFSEVTSDVAFIAYW